ncbi:MAG TPA: formate dehydrogenase subunit delta [Povalibacter sp.]|nr:formate dehydrogenase subunit delta [Povalibacter sp.]
MHQEVLVRMANDIGNFFVGGVTAQEATQGVLTHIRRYWDPRMRKQIIEIYRAGGEGLADHVRAAVALLAEEKKG